jgi:hypothetical protein
MTNVGIHCAIWILSPIVAAKGIKNVAEVFLFRELQLRAIRTINQGSGGTERGSQVTADEPGRSKDCIAAIH